MWPEYSMYFICREVILILRVAPIEIRPKFTPFTLAPYPFSGLQDYQDCENLPAQESRFASCRRFSIKVACIINFNAHPKHHFLEDEEFAKLKMKSKAIWNFKLPGYAVCPLRISQELFTEFG